MDYLNGTDPRNWDTAGDGVSDGDVVGGGDAHYDGLATLSLPYPVRVGGVSASNVTVSVNGIAWLLVGV